MRRRRAQFYRYNDSILIYSNRKLDLAEPQLNLIEYNTNLIETDLQRKTNRYNALKPIDQVLIAIQFYASGCLLQVVGDTTGVAITVLTHGKLHYGILIVG